MLDVDYSLDTVRRNLEPMLMTHLKKNQDQLASQGSDQSDYSPDLLCQKLCQKCGSKNTLQSSFCSTCGQRLQTKGGQISHLSTVKEQQDYVLQKGEKSREELRAEEMARRLMKADKVFDVKYLGGHKGYPTKKPRDAQIAIFVDRIEVKTDRFKAVIPYLRMINVENMDERRITVKRWFLVGLWAIPWKKKYVYTVIEYEDENDTLGLIFDFGKHLESKQHIIYERMIDARSKKSDGFGELCQ